MKAFFILFVILEILLIYLCRDNMIQYFAHLLGLLIGSGLVLPISFIRDPNFLKNFIFIPYRGFCHLDTL